MFVLMGHRTNLHGRTLGADGGEADDVREEEGHLLKGLHTHLLFVSQTFRNALRQHLVE